MNRRRALLNQLFEHTVAAFVVQLTQAALMNREQADHGEEHRGSGCVDQHELVVLRHLRVKKLNEVDREAVDQLVQEAHRGEHEAAVLVVADQIGGDRHRGDKNRGATDTVENGSAVHLPAFEALVRFVTEIEPGARDDREQAADQQDVLVGEEFAMSSMYRS